MPDLPGSASLWLVWTPACAPPETTLPHSQPTTDACDPPSGIIFPTVAGGRRTTCSETWSLCEQMPYLERFGPRWSRWVGVGLPGWGWPCWMGDDEWGSPGGLCEGWQTALWGSPPACPRQRVAGGSSQGHINQTLHLPLFHCLPCSVSLLVSLHILHQARRAEQWVFEQSTARPVCLTVAILQLNLGLFLHSCTRCLMLLRQGERSSPLSSPGACIKAEID